MQARMVTLTARPGHLDDVAGFFDDATVAEIAGQPGSRGFVLLKDVANERMVALSLWDSGAQADASATTFRRHMAVLADHLAGPPALGPTEVAAASGGPLGR